MDANENNDVPLRDEVFQIVGCAFEVLNELGHGYHEKPYERSLVVEMIQQQIPFTQQAVFPLLYKGHQVAEFIPDLLAFSTLVIDTKVVPRITDLERGQMLNYLKCTKLEVGVILNFAKPKLEWERVVRSRSKHSR